MIKPIKESSVRTRRKFEETFKREALHNWLASGKSAEVIAQELGPSANRLYAWKKIFAPAHPPISKASWTRCAGNWRACGSSGTY